MVNPLPGEVDKTKDQDPTQGKLDNLPAIGGPGKNFNNLQERKKRAKFIKNGRYMDGYTYFLVIILIISLFVPTFIYYNKYNNLLLGVPFFLLLIYLPEIYYLSFDKSININKETTIFLNIKKRKTSGVAIIGVSLITLELLKYLSLYYNIDNNGQTSPDKNKVYITDKHKYQGGFAGFNAIQFFLILFMIYYYLHTPVNKKVYFRIFLLYFICMMIPNFINFVSPLSNFKNSLLYSIYIVSGILFLTVVILPLISYFYPNEFSLNLFGQDDSIVEFNKDENFSSSENLINDHMKNKENLYNKIKRVKSQGNDFDEQIVKVDDKIAEINSLLPPLFTTQKQTELDRLNREKKDLVEKQKETNPIEFLDDTGKIKNINNSFLQKELQDTKKIIEDGDENFKYHIDDIDKLLNKGVTKVSVSTTTSAYDKSSIEDLIKKCEESGKRLNDSGITAASFEDANNVDANDYVGPTSLKSFEDVNNGKDAGKAPITYLGDKTQIKGNKKLYLTPEGEKNINFNQTKLSWKNNKSIIVGIGIVFFSFFVNTCAIVNHNTKRNTNTSVESIFKSINLLFPIVLFLIFNFYKPIYIYILLFNIFLISSIYFYIPNTNKDKDDFDQIYYVYTYFNIISLITLSIFIISIIVDLKNMTKDKEKHLTVFEKHHRAKTDGIIDYKTDENQNLFKV